MKEKILDIAKQEIEQNGFFVPLIKGVANNNIKIFVDGKNPVDLGLCTQWNRAIRERIEQEIPNYQNGDFELEVSSFGIGEPLVDIRQYVVNIGRIAKIDFADEHHKIKQITGRLIQADMQMIGIESIIGKGKKARKEISNININEIKKAIIEVEF